MVLPHNEKNIDAQIERLEYELYDLMGGEFRIVEREWFHCEVRLRRVQ